MNNHSWRDPLKKQQETIDSWKKILLDLDNERSESLDSLTENAGGAAAASWSIGTVHHCHQLETFPMRPELRDLVPCTKRAGVDTQAPAVVMISARAIREQIRKRRRLRSGTGHGDSNDNNKSLQKIAGVKIEEIQGKLTSRQNSSESEGTKVALKDIQTAERGLDGFQDAVCSLREKLEILQPDGKRPSDIEAAARPGDDALPIEMIVEASNENEVLLSQTASSQRSILLWDEIRIIVELATSGVDEISRQAKSEIARLGLEDLEDNVLHRLCVNELFAQDQKKMTDNSDDSLIKAPINTSGLEVQLSYPSSLYLYRLLFLRKTLELKSAPSRLFLDAMLSAGKVHGRAMVDGVLLPVVKEYDRYSKHISEVVQKIMKEQTSPTMVHFLSQIFDSVPEHQDPGMSSATFAGSTLSRLSIMFVTEIHLSTLQTILGFNNVPCPAPTRLWTSLNNLLEQLWDYVSTAITSESNSGSEQQSLVLDSKDAQVSIVKIYITQGLWETLFETAKGGMAARKAALADLGPIRLSNTKLIQLLMTWVVRQGPLCSDVGNLQRIQQFCGSKLDERLAKGLVSKLDTFIKRKTK